jgi:hypothetical protein
MPTAWEYQTISVDKFLPQNLLAQLNAQGEFGWELVAIVPGRLDTYYAFLKRAKPTPVVKPSSNTPRE